MLSLICPRIIPHDGLPIFIQLDSRDLLDPHSMYRYFQLNHIPNISLKLFQHTISILPNTSFLMLLNAFHIPYLSPSCMQDSQPLPILPHLFIFPFISSIPIPSIPSITIPFQFPSHSSIPFISSISSIPFIPSPFP